MSRLATIGYEGASIEDFIATLKFANVERIIDVRDVPISRRKGFSKNQLSEALDNAGIMYVHLKALGDPKEGRDAAKSGAYDKFKRIYSAHLGTKSARIALAEAAALAQSESSCLLCYERDHKICHRTMVAESLSNIVELEVKHLGVRDGLARRGRNVGTRKNSRTRESFAACGQVAR